MTHELLGQLAGRKETFTQNPVSVNQMGELIDMVQNGSITGEYPHLFSEFGTSCMPSKGPRVKRFCAI